MSGEPFLAAGDPIDGVEFGQALHGVEKGGIENGVGGPGTVWSAVEFSRFGTELDGKRDDLIGDKVPQTAVAKFERGLWKAGAFENADGVEGLLISAADEDFIFGGGSEIDLSEDLVGERIGDIGGGGQEGVASRGRGEAEGGEIGDDILGEIDNFQSTQVIEELLDGVGIGWGLERLDDGPCVGGGALQGKAVSGLDFNSADSGQGCGDELSIPKVSMFNAQEIGEILWDQNDVAVAEESGIDEVWIVSRGIAELDLEDGIAALGQGEVERRRGQAERFDVGLGIIGDKLMDAGVAQFLDEIGDDARIGGGTQGADQLPELVGLIELDGNDAAAIGDEQAIKEQARLAQDEGVTPVENGLGQELEEAAVGHGDACFTEALEINLVADEGF